MIRYIVCFLALLLCVSLYGNQVHVVAELFSSTTCFACPAARAALNLMRADISRFGHLIPMIWQTDQYTSPGVTPRQELYNVGPLPHVQWSGIQQTIGATPITAYANYTNAYNANVTFVSPVLIDFDYSYMPGDLNIQGEINLTGSLMGQDYKIVFVVTTDLPTGGADYFAYVTAYQHIDLHISDIGQSQTFNISLTDLPTDIDRSKANIIVIVQSYGLSKRIYQAASRRLTDILPPANLRSFAGTGNVSLTWDRPQTHGLITQFHITRDGLPFGTVSGNQTHFVDDAVAPSTTYIYTVSALYGSISSEATAIVTASTMAKFAQLGGGSLVHNNTLPGPLNVYNSSLRGQFIYTAQELNLAGIKTPIEISAIGFFVESPPATPLPMYTIRIKHTTDTDVLAHDPGPFDSMSLVVNYTPQSGGFEMLTLLDPFIWNGQDNILFDTAFAPVSAMSSTGVVRVNIGSGGYRYSWHGSQSMIDATTTVTLPYKPQLLIAYQPTTSIKDEFIIGKSHILQKNHPNPFNPNTTISFDMVGTENVRIDIFNVKGQLIKTLVDAIYDAGQHYAHWDGTDQMGQKAPTGVYLYRMQTMSYSSTKKMVMIK